MSDDIASAASSPTAPAAPPTEPFTLAVADGVDLEAEIRVPADPIGAVVLAHPHPLHGGTMRSLVTSELFRVLPERGVAALRFNFRGVEGSTGAHGEGRAEKADVVAAIDMMASRVDASLPLVLAGWSFGADVSLSVDHDRLAGWFLIASPLRILPAEEMVAAHDPRPKVFAIPEHDEFRRPDGVLAFTAGWENVTVHAIAGADHYLVGRTARVADLLVGLVERAASA